MIVTIGLVSLISVMMATIFANGEKQYRVGSKQISQNEKAALAVRDFEKIARGATGIISANPNSLSFYSYLKGDNHPAPSKINYYIENGILYRSLIPPAVTDGQITYPESDKIIKQISDHLVNENLFSFYGDTNEVLNFPVQNDVIRMAKMLVEIDEDTNNSPEKAAQSTAVEFRNLKNNL
jgi:hypothetical protein